MKRLLLLLATLALLLVVFSPTALAGVFDLVPPLPPEAGAYSTTPAYERFSLSAYVFDYKDSYTGTQDKLFMAVTNTLLLLKAWLVKLAIRSMEYAVCGDLLAPLTQVAGTAMNALGQWIWEIDGAPLVVAALAFAALCGLFAAFSKRLTRSVQIMAGTALVLIASYALLAAVPDTLPAARGLAREVSRQAVGVVAKAAQAESAEELIVKAGGAGWEIFVYEPWLDGEFNDRAAAAEYSASGLAGGGILAMKLDERPKIYTDRLPAVGGAIHPHFQPWRPEFVEWRMLLAVFTLLCGGAYALSLLLLAGGIIFSQLVFLVAAALLPLWLLAALWWPPAGVRLFRRVLAVVLGALLKQAALAATLAVLLVLLVALKAALPGSGWVLQALFAALLAAAAYLCRFAWLKGLAAPFVMETDKPAAVIKKEERGAPAVFFPAAYSEEGRTETEGAENMAPTLLQLPRVSDEGKREAAINPMTRPAWSAAAGPAEFRREMMALRQRR